MKLPRPGIWLFALATTFVAVPAAADEPARLAGLWRFLHGDPLPPPKAPPPKQLAKVSSAAGVVTDAEVEGFLRAFAGALKARDGQPMLARLSDKYTIDDLPNGRKATDMFQQAIEQIPGPEEIVVVSLDRKADLRIAKVEMRYAAGAAKGKTLH